MACALDSAGRLGHALRMDDDAPKCGRGRPRIHADSKAAASARAAAHVRAKRESLNQRTVYLDDDTAARADALVAVWKLRGFTELVEDLVRKADLPGRE